MCVKRRIYLSAFKKVVLSPDEENCSNLLKQTAKEKYGL